MLEETLRRWSEEAEVRCRDLTVDGFGDRTVEAATEAVASWRWSGAESGVHRLEPFSFERRGSREGWLDEPPRYGSVDRVGFDAAGRPSIVVSWFEGRENAVVEVWEHTPERSVGLWRLDDTEGSEPRASVTFLDDAARPTAVVTARQDWAWIDGVRQVDVSIERWTWEGDRVTHGALRPASAADRWHAGSGGAILLALGGDDGAPGLDGDPAVVEPTYDADGTLVQLVVDGRPLLGDAADAWLDDAFPQLRDHSIELDPALVSGAPKGAVPPAARSLRDLLDRCLAAHDVVVDGEEIGPVSPELMHRVWLAFKAFAALPVDGLRPGLRVPEPGQSDLDTLSCDRSLGKEPDLPRNIQGNPPYVSLRRQLYLVNDDDEFADWEAAGLSLYLSSTPYTRDGSFIGAGGPPVSGVDGVAAWVETVEGRTWWPTLFTEGALLGIRRW